MMALYNFLFLTIIIVGFVLVSIIKLIIKLFSDKSPDNDNEIEYENDDEWCGGTGNCNYCHLSDVCKGLPRPDEKEDDSLKEWFPFSMFSTSNDNNKNDNHKSFW